MGAALEQAWPFGAAVLVVLGACALGALIVVFIRLAQVLKTANKSLDDVNVLLDKTNKELGPALERVDPIMEKATLTVDTLNLELLRVDAILEDVEGVTDAADGAVNAVERVANMPADAVAGIAERFRGRVDKAGKNGIASSEQKRLVYPAGKADGGESGKKAEGEGSGTAKKRHATQMGGKPVKASAAHKHKMQEENAAAEPPAAEGELDALSSLAGSDEEPRGLHSVTSSDAGNTAPAEPEEPGEASAQGA